MQSCVVLEILGWSGSLVLVFSLLQTKMWRLRTLNLAACVILTIYNYFVNVWPMMAVNAVIGLVNIVHIMLAVRGRSETAIGEAGVRCNGAMKLAAPSFRHSFHRVPHAERCAGVKRGDLGRDRLPDTRL